MSSFFFFFDFFFTRNELLLIVPFVVFLFCSTFLLIFSFVFFVFFVFLFFFQRYVACLSNIFVKWEGSKLIGGALSSLVSKGKERTNINPKNYAKRLLQYMNGSVLSGTGKNTERQEVAL